MNVKSIRRHGISLVKDLNADKIGLVEWFEVRRHSRRLYVLIDPKDVRMHDIQVGDRIRMKLDVIVKGVRDLEETEIEIVDREGRPISREKRKRSHDL